MDSFHDIFESVLAYCKTKMSATAYDLWIRAIEPAGFDGETVSLSVKSKIKWSVVTSKYSALLDEAFEDVLGFKAAVVIDCEEDSLGSSAPESPLSQDEPYSDEYDFSFASYIVGSSNKFAHAASLAVAANPGGSYNPLFIYGNSGLGKTHLLYAISNEIKATRPDMQILYIKGESFVNEFIDAIKNGATPAFREKYRKNDVLLVDDIQFIGGKEGMQEEFFHTFNTLYEARKQIVLSSDRPPKEIKTLEERLRTRFEWGLLADIQPPDFETRMAIIQRKAEMLELPITEEVTEYIASRLKTNIRQLEGAVRKLAAYNNIAGTSPSILVAQNAIRDILNDNQPVPITIERIISEVSRTFGITPENIKSAKQSQPISTARQVAMYVIREITQMSMTAIGEEVGGKNHSTVVYAIQQVEKKMKTDQKFRETVEDITKNIREK